MSRIFALAAVSALVPFSSGFAQDVVTVEATVKVVDLTDRSNPPPVIPLSVRANLAQIAPEGAALPDDLMDAWSGVVEIGSRKLVVAVGKSAEDLDLPDMMCVDLDWDGEFSIIERMVIDVSTRNVRGTQVAQSDPIEVEIEAGDSVVMAQLLFAHAGERTPTVTLLTPSYLEAKLELGGAERVVAVLDQDYDGTFGSAGDAWALGTPGGRPANAFALSLMGERRFEDGQLIGIAVSGTSVKLTTEAAKGPDPKDAAAHRQRVEHIWMARFDDEREQFVAARGLDTSRPLAETPVDWNYVTFDQALALGKKAGKPVFVDVMAFWCVWCYRMDYYTYPDAEVAKMLNGDFIPVKLIQEQDLAGDYNRVMKEKLEARGIPAMGIFDGDGNVLHKIGGWKNPEDFLKELETGKSKG